MEKFIISLLTLLVAFTATGQVSPEFQMELDSMFRVIREKKEVTKEISQWRFTYDYELPKKMSERKLYKKVKAWLFYMHHNGLRSSNWYQKSHWEIFACSIEGGLYLPEERYREAKFKDFTSFCIEINTTPNSITFELNKLWPWGGQYVDSLDPWYVDHKDDYKRFFQEYSYNLFQSLVEHLSNR